MIGLFFLCLNLNIFLLSDGKRFEIEFFGNYIFPEFKGTYSYYYSPPFSPGAYLSSSDLSLNYMAENRMGYGLGINYFLKENIGLRLELNYFRASLKGESSKYNLNLQYVSMQPPSYTPHLYLFQKSIEWDQPDGDIKRVNTTLNFISRVKIGNSISSDFLLGFCHEISRLDLRSIGYTKFWLGGHSVLFSETYKIEISSGKIKDFGLSGGINLNIFLSKNLYITSGIRYFYFPTRFASIELKEQTNREETIMDLKPQDLQALKVGMKLRPIEFPKSSSSLTISLRLRL